MAGSIEGPRASEVEFADERPRVVEVVVKEMPEPPHKSLWKDSGRLLSVSAFMFSLATGAYAAYSTWTAKIDASVEEVGKQIGMYYQNTEKLKSIDPRTDTAYFNLIRTQQRSQATQALTKALSVARYVDAGLWMSLAQIFTTEQNCAVADKSWRAAADKTTDVGEYSFSLRGIAYTDACLHKLDDAALQLERAVKAISADEVKEPRTMINNMAPIARSVEISSIHVTWLTLFPPTDCKVVAPHYDAAKAALADALLHVAPTDEASRKLIAGASQAVEWFAAARAQCP
jgi:hypothetical protein